MEKQCYECKHEQQVLANDDPKPEQLLRVWKSATCDLLIPFSSRRMQTTWSPDQTAWSSRLTRSRNSLFFSSSKVNLIFCFCFLPDEATEGQRRWSEVAAAPSLLYTHFHLLLSVLISFAYLNLICPPPLPTRFSSCCAANDADPHLPAGNPGAG